jgi:hypothetical protein
MVFGFSFLSLWYNNKNLPDFSFLSFLLRDVLFHRVIKNGLDSERSQPANRNNFIKSHVTNVLIKIFHVVRQLLRREENHVTKRVMNMNVEEERKRST